MPAPKKPRRAKSKKINVSVRSQWEAILKSVSKDEVPVEMLESLTVNLMNNTKVNINIKDLIKGGLTPKEIERRINSQLAELDEQIDDVDFFICIDSVVSTISPMVAHILKHI